MKFTFHKIKNSEKMKSFLLAVVAVWVAAVAAVSGMKMDTAGDPSTFKADPTIITNSSMTLGGASYGWTEYKQCDSRWSGQQLGTCSQTICSAGCAMSSVAMIVATRGGNYNPSSLDSWLTKNGGYANGCNIYWGKVDSLGHTKFQAIETATEAEICSGLSKGHGIVANVNGGGHWVLLTKCLGGGVFAVNDPGYSRTTYSMGDILREAVYW
jgi:hypothetical protein